MKRYETDVLIIGGGGAATASCISAHENGARTTLAVKGRFGVPGVRGAGATSNPIGDYWTIRTVGPKGGFFNPPDLVYADMLQAGLGMANPALCKIFVEEVTDAVKRLREMGVYFKSRVLATMEAKQTDHKTNTIVAIQKAVIEGTNTQVIEHANFTDLISRDGRCCGAVGVDDDGNPFMVEAGAVVMATGGVGQLFRHSFNPPGNTGDGYAMAMRAGADLMNMEFMQQGLATVWPNQAMMQLYEMEDPYRLLNAEGRYFLEDYIPDGVDVLEVSHRKSNHWPVTCRDSGIYLDQAIKRETLAGRATPANGIFLDYSNADRGFEPELFVEFMTEKGIDVRKDMIQVQVHHHTSNGGVRIDTDAQASLRGLFACGEVAGWQGADRLGGTMLGGSQVWGWRAGRKAADVSRDRDYSVQPDDVQALFEPLERLREAKGQTRPDDLRPELQRVMWECLIVEKDQESLDRARNYIAEDRDRLERDLRIAEPLDHAIAFEHRNLLDVAEAIVTAATLRTESRGSHIRTDFPDRDDANWLTNIMLSKPDGELKARREWASEAFGWEDQPGDIRIMPWG